MKDLGAYILSVTAAAILSGILQSLVDKKTAISVLFQLIGGIFLAFTVIAPIADIELDLLLEFPMEFTQDGMIIATNGYNDSQQQLHEIIKQRCEAYILDKAKSYQASLDVDVSLSHADVPIPISVKLKGDTSPYTKKAMQSWLVNEMGISEENQLWIE